MDLPSAFVGETLSLGIFKASVTLDIFQDNKKAYL